MIIFFVHYINVALHWAALYSFWIKGCELLAICIVTMRSWLGVPGQLVLAADEMHLINLPYLQSGNRVEESKQEKELK